MFRNDDNRRFAIGRSCRASLICSVLMLACGGGGGSSAGGGGTTDPPPPPTTYSLSVSGTGNGSGSVTSSPSGISCTVTAGAASGSCSASYTAGGTVALSSTAAGGSTFGAWGGDCTGAGACTVTLDRARSVQASFGVPQTVSTLSVQPQFLTIGVGATGTLTVDAKDASGGSVPNSALVFTSRDESVATLNGSTVTGRRPGAARLVVAGSGKTDSATVAVVPGDGFAILPSSSSSQTTVSATAAGTVVVTLYVVKPSNGVGDLGSLGGSLTWDASRLEFQSTAAAAPGWTWLSNAAGASSGSITFAGFAAAQGITATGAVATFTFRVTGAAGSASNLAVTISNAGTTAGRDMTASLVPVAAQVRIQ